MGVIAVVVAGMALSFGVFLIVTSLMPSRASDERAVKQHIDIRRLGSRALVAVMVAGAVNWFSACCVGISVL